MILHCNLINYARKFLSIGIPVSKFKQRRKVGFFDKMNTEKPQNKLKSSQRLIRVLLLCLVLLSSCQKNDTASTKQQTLRTCLAADISTLDPRKGTDMATQGVIRMLFAGLVYLDQNLVPQLDLASSYQISDDFKTYTFFLKESRWSDGSLITAQDFAESWKTALT